jgi:acetolactate synthase-1/2/3 large subunit
MIKVSEYIIDFLLINDIDTIFTISGGFIGPILQSIQNKIKYYCFSHEQAAAMAADGYYRISKKPACLLITNGPGSTNTISGVVGAFQDSIPIFIISGNVPLNQGICSQDLELRQLGIQEVNIIPIINTVTKYSKNIISKNEIPLELDKALYVSITGRMGPVWIDIPLDIQNEYLMEFPKSIIMEKNICISDYLIISEKIKNSKCPLILIGNGVRNSNAENALLNFINTTNIPFVSSWLGKDIIKNDHELYFGNIGIFGERFSNFAIQKTDLLIVLGCRLNLTHIGYDYLNFSKKSYKIMVDIDLNEINKKTINIDLKINEDILSFLNNLKLNYNKKQCWIDKLVHWKKKYKTFDSTGINLLDNVNSYFFAENLNLFLNDNTTIVTDTGTSSFTIFQYFCINKNNLRLFTASGQSCMGYGLPGAIGACIANPSLSTILICGDGGFQFNIQELQTVYHYNLNIKIFILNNNGYLAIKLMQKNLNYDRIGCDINSGVSSPDFIEISKAYKIKHFSITHNKDMYKIKDVIEYNGPCICNISMLEDQLLCPRVQSYGDNKSLEFMYPFIDEEELKLENIL